MHVLLEKRRKRALISFGVRGEGGKGKTQGIEEDVPDSKKNKREKASGKRDNRPKKGSVGEAS